MKNFWKLITGTLLAIVVGYTFLVKSIVPSYVDKLLPEIEKQACAYVNGSVKIGGVNWQGGLTINVNDIVLLDKKQEKVAEIPTTVVSLKPWKALEKTERAISRVELLKPVVYLTMDDKQRWNTQNLLKPSDSEETPFYGLLQIKEGTLKVKTPDGHWQYGVEADADAGANPNFDVKALVTSGEEKLKAKGIVNSKGVGQISLESNSLSLKPYKAVIEHYAAIKELEGKVTDLALKLDNDGKKVKLSGQGMGKAISGKVKTDGEEHSFKVDAELKCIDNQLTVKKLAALVDEQLVNLEGTVDVTEWERPNGAGVLNAPKLSYKGETVENVKISFGAGKDVLQITEATLDYGQGRVKASGTADLEKLAMVGDVELINFHYAPSGNDANAVTINGHMALTAKQKEDSSYEVHAAADSMGMFWKGMDINKFALDGSYQQGMLNIEHVSMQSKDGSMAVKGWLKDDGALELKGRMAHFPVHPFLEIAGINGGQGYCSTGFSVGGNLKAPSFDGAIQLLDADILEQKIKEAHGRVILKDNILTLKKIKAHMEQGRHLVDGTIDLNGVEPVFDLSVETNGVRMEPIMKLVAPEVALTGNVDNLLELKGTPSQPIVSGEVNLTDGSANHFYLLDQVQGRYYYNKGLLALKNVVIRSLGSQVDIEGTMKGEQKALDFDILAKDIRMDYLPIQENGVTLDGRVDFKGKLTGYMDRPFFEGDVNSEKVVVNGEVISNIKGKLTSNTTTLNHLQVSFEQPHNHNKVQKGTYDADVNLNRPEQFLKGNVKIEDGDLAGILRLCKQDYAMEGLLDGDIAICPEGKGSGIDILANLSEVKIHDRKYQGMDFKGKLKQYVLYLDDVTLNESKVLVDRGILKATGKVDLKQKLLDVEVKATRINPSIATALMKNPPKINGETDMDLKLVGSYDDLRELKGSADIAIDKGSVEGVVMDKAICKLTLEDDTISLKKLTANKDIYSVEAAGSIPLDLFRNKDKRYNPQAEMNILVDLNNARLGILPALCPMVEWGVGDIHGNVTVAGTLEEPMVYGSTTIEEGSVKFKHVATVVDKLHLDAEFLGNKVELTDLSAQLGKGKLAIDGSYALRTVAGEEYKLHVLAEDAQVASDIFTGRINGEMAVVPQSYRDIRKTKGNIVPPIDYRPLVKGNIKLDDVLLNIATVPEFGEGESNIGLDLSLQLGPRIHMLNSMLYDIWLSGGVAVKGSTLFPIVNGRIQADKGSVSYLRTNFKLSDASLVWIDPGSFLPYVKLNGKTRFSRYNIFMNIDGPVDAMTLKLTSNPELEQNTIVRMLTLQRDSVGSNDITNDDMNNVMLAGLQMTFLGDVEMFVKQTLGLDQFRIYNGKVRTGVGFENATALSRELTEEEKKQYNIVASKFVTSHIQLGYSTSFDNDHSSMFGQYEFSRKFNITYSHSRDMDKRDNWFGLEYQINF